MELRHLRYFAAVAHELHFGRAAQKLNITQPPLTLQIQNLEEELGVNLLIRSNRKVQLTKEGTLFLKRAESILHQSERAVCEVRKSALGQMDTLVIGYMGSTILRQITGMIKSFRDHYPAVKLEFVIMRSDEQYEALVDGKIDAGFVDLAMQPMSERFQSHKVQFDLIFHEQLCVAVRKGHPFEGRESIAISELKEEYFVALPRHSFPSHHDKVVSLCEQAGFCPNITATSEQTDVLMTYVSIGMGIALVPQCVTSGWVNDAAFVPLEDCSFVDVHLITRMEHATPSVEAFRKTFAGYGLNEAMR